MRICGRLWCLPWIAFECFEAQLEDVVYCPENHLMNTDFSSDESSCCSIPQGEWYLAIHPLRTAPEIFLGLMGVAHTHQIPVSGFEPHCSRNLCWLDVGGDGGG